MDFVQNHDVVTEMKRKMWVASPFMYIAVFVMYLMSFLSYGVNTTVFIVELCIATIFAISLLSIRMQFWFHIRFAMKSAKKVLLAQEEQNLSDVSMPIVVTGENGDIIWSNKAFENDFKIDEGVIGSSLLQFIYPKTIKQIFGESGANIKYKNKQYTVYAVKTEYSNIFYFVDDTYFKDIYKEYTEKKTVISIISFDNKEELIRGFGSGEESRITTEVEHVLREWSHEMGGFMRKLTNGRYLLISDEAHMDQAKKRKFAVLDRVRKIKGRDDLSATVSIGIGRNADTASKSEEWATQALEMALGRGGDQVAIYRKGESYEFFGGISKGVEKRDRVRTRVIAVTLAEQIRKADKVYVMGHRNSDFDSLGSAIGVWSAVIKSAKKNAFIVINQSSSLALPLVESMYHEYPEQRIFISPQEAQQEITEKTLLVIVDTHADNFVECPELLTATKAIVVIDHHRMMVNYIKNPIIFYHEPYASSASEMVAELIQYMDSSALGRVEAQALLSGIMLDTKNFILKTGIRTFEAAAFLRRTGADLVEVKRYFSNSIGTYREKSQLIANAQVYKECAIATTEDVTPNTRVSAAQAADELLSINGVKASFVLFGKDREISISGRSLGDINVQVILEEFGGGGHLTMAGAQVRGKEMQEVKKSLVDIINIKIEN